MHTSNEYTNNDTANTKTTDNTKLISKNIS